MIPTGELIKRLRKESGLTQEQLAEGVCTRLTITRIEQGKVEPNYFTKWRILQKLGKNPALYIADTVSDREAQILRLGDRLYDLHAKKQYDVLEAELREVQGTELFSQGEGLRVLLNAEGNLHLGRKEFDEAIECFTRSILLLRPDFDLNKVTEYCLSDGEMRSILNIAATHLARHDFEKSIGILRNLKKHEQFMYAENRTDSHTLNVINYNYVSCLYGLGGYFECLTECEKALDTAFETTDMVIFAAYLKGIALCKLQLGYDDAEEASDRYRAFLRGMGGEDLIAYKLREFETLVGEVAIELKTNT